MPDHSSPQVRRPTHYDVLQLDRHADWTRLTPDDVKAAYRRALLIHHPDKTTILSRPAKPSPTPTHSIDDIVVAYEILSDPEKRAAYNAVLDTRDGLGLTEKSAHIGVEAFDLEDLNYDETKSIWSKSCRCGDEHGYILTESDLERETQHGEIYVGCRGCSLFIKVLFGLEE
ncbi:Diphthamide biosynthesis protein 4 [Elasticomyces elasticus]|uniref:Diphthamide biosynthesis protein 4 n=1 Tax=Exophiala sideris TaxID=1016849 RepID=A0ABR0J5D5_9EURO|nr:Diphthamide biosynthesis protein 4 [Elasticomyces elasticus]KAK5026914.1 Diphthamide biosynthesis protein 4 [Exophiala sideris]KAK5033918.1 Diphthamide biosynthesis protein 4 [Exophiala sideris]KAK5055807.1 Diphthamide biosynthesis protein 4 [Exophiala sideris]KAK5180860.1 Diphthamide biosynthesis protein 4 [Eurotiomycetes sp. CCFEE 6388]